MDIYKKLGLEPIMPQPDVWLSRLVIFEKTTPEPAILQDIPLSRGLNIIVADEAQDDQNLPSGITGHSAGKTTFCRFLRYALGEKTFGRTAVTKLIRKAFPDGYIAAQLHIKGREWAVMRPIGAGWASYAKTDVSIEELIQNRGRAITLESYPKTLGLEAFQSDLATTEIVQLAEPIRWAHLLAWCTRDQETRYQSFHEWRSQRSESESLSFRTDSRAHPQFIMRLMLGLFSENEVETEKELAKLHQEKEALLKEIGEKGREPEYRVNLYDRQLRKALKIRFPKEPGMDSRPLLSDDILPMDLTRMTQSAQGQMVDNIELRNQEINSLQDRMDDLGAKKKQLEDKLDEMNTSFVFSTAATRELESGLSEKNKQRQSIEEKQNQLCTLGDTLFRDCVHIKKRQKVLQITETQDAQAMAKAKARREEECRKVEESKEALRVRIQKLESELQEAKTRRDTLRAEQKEIQDAHTELKKAYDELVYWTEKRDQPGGYDELDRLRDREKVIEDKTRRTEEELDALLRKHNENQKLLTSIFSWAVKLVLSTGDYDGKVDFKNRELRFDLTHGAAMTGEAVETLSVLLADISCLVFNSLSASAHLPGLLVHDSPREADLGKRIYYSFIRLVAGLQGHFEAANACPFQYILTTTTPPPQELDKDEFVKLRLNAGIKERLLLRRNIADALSNQDALNFS